MTPPNYGGGGTLLHRADEDFLIFRYSHNHKSTLITREAREKHQGVLETKPIEHYHHEAFVQACMGNGQTNSPFSIGGPLTQTLLMGVICQYLNTDLTFDPSTMRFAGNSAANAMLDGPVPRQGWEDYYRDL